MKKKKITALVLAAMLFFGGAFAGTKALFMDKTEVAAELSISTGDLDIEVEKEGKWKIERVGEINELLDKTKNVDEERDSKTENNGQIITKDSDIEKPEATKSSIADNLKPGDILTKTITIKNAGTLVATNLNVTENGDDTNNLYKLSHELEIKSSPEAKNVNNVLVPGQTAELKLKLEVKGYEEDDYHAKKSEKLKKDEKKSVNNGDEKENEIINLENAWTLTAKQQSKK